MLDDETDKAEVAELEKRLRDRGIDIDLAACDAPSSDEDADPDDLDAWKR